MEKQGWKITAIILLILLIASLGFTAAIFKSAQSYEAKRNQCFHDICGMGSQEHDSYYLAPDDYCYCFLKGELDIVEKVSLD